MTTDTSGCTADDFDAIVHVVPPGDAKTERCQYCDGTGDVHTITGEWRGVCTECEEGRDLGASIASNFAWRAYERAWPEAMCGYEFYHADELAEAKARALEIYRSIRVE